MVKLRRSVYRGLVTVYVATFALLLVANVPPIGELLFQAQESEIWLRVALGLMGVVSAVAFFVLFGHCLYYWGTHHTEGPGKLRWFLVIVGLNFVGIVIYYLWVIEREQGAVRAV